MSKKPKEKMPIRRAVFYLVLVCLLPVFGVAFYLHQEKTAWEDVSEKLTAVHTLSLTKERKQALNNKVRAFYSDASQEYLKTHLESINLLKTERQALEALTQSPAFTGNRVTEQRYAQLSGDANALRLQEIDAQTGEGMIETVHRLDHPIEIDAADLHTILSVVEEQNANKPQLLITNFLLEKKRHPDGNEVYSLNLKLLKREFVQ